MSNGITFQVETSRILEILAREIYDSPWALLRENVQNAYDAVRMRFASQGALEAGGRIMISVEGNRIEISDNGVGMDEETLRNNFWKAGASGKRTQAARQAGVVGTFGIGAMANFGVCSELTVETRRTGATETLVSTARRDELKIAEECISLERRLEAREPGTTVRAILDETIQISTATAREYLLPYVANLPVPVELGGELISQRPLRDLLQTQNRVFSRIGERIILPTTGFGGTFEVFVDPNGQVLLEAKDITAVSERVEGSMVLLQSGGQLMGMRSGFGLAPIPVAGHFSFGGYANLSFLSPTAGREAIARECISQVGKLIELAELAACETLGATSSADSNNAFLSWVFAHVRFDLAKAVSILMYPENENVKLGNVLQATAKKRTHYYTGNDRSIINTFAGEGAALLQISPNNPRRKLQLEYVKTILKVPEVPDSAQILKRFEGSELTPREAAIMIRIGAIVRDDYLVPDVDVAMARISHGVSVLVKPVSGRLTIYVARESAILSPLNEFYDKAYDLFTQFMKDFVRVQIYPRIQSYVPSSTKDGVEALRKLLQRNRELYRYDEEELGDVTGLLGDYLSGDVSFPEVLKQSRIRARSQSQTLRKEHVGTIEGEIPGIEEAPIVDNTAITNVYEAVPPIVRDSISSDKKLLISDEKYPLLNNFQMLIGLSDRLMRSESDFFRTAHTTRVLWGGHRVVYIFTESSGRLSLYYDIELREPLEHGKAGGGMFPTTTLIMKDRIFVPIPDQLTAEFRVATGAKEFFVRFDILTSGAAQ